MAKRSHRHLLCATALAALCSGGVRAQQVPAPSPATPSAETPPLQSTASPTQDPAANSNPGDPRPADESGDTIGDIIVTANKRQESAQKVAATVNAVSQENIIRQGVKEISDLNKVIPEVSVTTGPLSAITIRGVRAAAPGPTLDSPNAVHIDGAYVSRFTALQSLFFDVQRVEVLQGPQGTLYGRNSVGGTINVITNKPNHELGGYGSVEYGNYDALTVNAALNLPVSDTLSARVAYFHNSRDGYYNNGYLDADQDAFRVSALWEPTANDSLLLTADNEFIRGQTRIGNAVATITGVIKNPTIRTNANGSVSLVPAGTAGGVVVPIVPSRDRRDSQALVGDLDQSDQHTNAGGYMGQYDHDFGWATLTAQAAYRYVHVDNLNGSTSGLRQDPRVLTAGVIRPLAPNSFEIANARENTQEIRLTSPSNKPITYVIGGYRFYEKAYGNELGSFLTRYPNTSAADVGTFVIPTPLIYNTRIVNQLQTNEAYSAFGQVTWSPMGPVGLHLTGGLRYNHEKKHGIGYTVLNTARVPQATYDLRLKESAVTYKANASYDLSDRNLIYFDHSTGFQPGGFGYGIRPQYGSTKIKAYEVGTKNRFFGDRLLLNAAAWHYDYSDLVVQVTEFYINNQTGFPAGSPTLANARRAKIDGQSLSLEARVTPRDTISLNGTHVNARYTDFNLLDRYQVAINAGILVGATARDFDFSHTRIGLTFPWAGNATYDHVFDVLGGQLDAQAAVRYQGRQVLAPLATPYTSNTYLRSKELTTVDLSLSYRPGGAKWSLVGYVRNVGNEKVAASQAYISNTVYLPPSDPRVLFAYQATTFTPPRTYGLIARLDF